MRKNIKGFTLVELLLVMVIIGVIMFAGMRYIEQRTLQMRIDRTSLQMQQILNAGLAYYVNNGEWPASISCLQGTGGSPCDTVYLPSTPITNPWGQPYNVSNTDQLFYVWTTVTAAASNTTGSARSAATVIAGTLPLAYTSRDTGTPPDPGTACTNTGNCLVVSSVNIPGQNLNNAGAVNFAGIYHHGACVPVPSCPVDQAGNNLVPQIMVVPVSVSGVNDPSPSTDVYPISSFTAYATSNNGTGTPTDFNPPTCSAVSADTNCYSSNGVAITSGAYWRVCLQVITEKGDVSQTNTDTGAEAWGKDVTLMAVTRCAKSTENVGSDFTVFSQ